MKIPDSEKQALLDWSTAELDRIAKEFPYIPGQLDGYGVVAQKAHMKEFNERVVALHAKYDNVNPVTKSRTFNEILQHA